MHGATHVCPLPTLRATNAAYPLEKVAIVNGAEPHSILEEYIEILQDPTWEGGKDLNRGMAMAVFQIFCASS